MNRKSRGTMGGTHFTVAGLNGFAIRQNFSDVGKCLLISGRVMDGFPLMEVDNSLCQALLVAEGSIMFRLFPSQSPFSPDFLL
jgi:hypothetical protein